MQERHITPENNAKLDKARVLVQDKQFEFALKIFIELFNDGHELVASDIAWIYNQKPNVRKDLSIKYYTMAADLGDEYANWGLGGLYFELGKTNDAIKNYKVAADKGNADCSYALSKIYKQIDDNDLAEHYLEEASHQGNAFATRDLAVSYLAGKKGM